MTIIWPEVYSGELGSYTYDYEPIIAVLFSVKIVVLIFGIVLSRVINTVDSEALGLSILLRMLGWSGVRSSYDRCEI